ncbi:MAG: GntR family transcriptional regulator [Pseudomonadota bacterium]
MHSRQATEDVLSEPVAALAGGRLAERAYDRLTELMFGGALAPGAVLQERALAERLGISRTPVREALARLEAEGFLTRHAARLLLVREMPVREFIEILHLRTVLECDALERAIGRIADDALAALRLAIERLLDDPNPDVAGQQAADDGLHGLIVEAGDNQVRTDLVLQLRRRTRMVNLKSLPERLRPGCEEHLAIVDALQRRDLIAAQSAITTHFENVKRGILHRLGRA